MIYFGSGAEYDRSNNIPNMSEDYFDTSVPKDAYGLSKYIMAKACLNQKNIYELCLFGVYGNMRNGREDLSLMRYVVH